MTLKEFCEKYNKNEKNVRAKLNYHIRKHKDILNDHIETAPYSRNVIFDEYVEELLLETHIKKAEKNNNEVTFSNGDKEHICLYQRLNDEQKKVCDDFIRWMLIKPQVMEYINCKLTLDIIEKNQVLCNDFKSLEANAQEHKFNNE
ncbi:hypothetical protein [Huintestinicola sp.]